MGAGCPGARAADRSAARRPSQLTGGGVPCAVAASPGSQPHTSQACSTTARPNSSTVACGSGSVRTSSQSSTYSPSSAFQPPAGSAAPVNSAGGGGAQGEEGGGAERGAAGHPPDQE